MKKTERQLILESFNIFFCHECSEDKKILKFVNGKRRDPTYCFHVRYNAVFNGNKVKGIKLANIHS